MGVTHKYVADRARVEILVFTCRKADLEFKILLWHGPSLISGLRFAPHTPEDRGAFVSSQRF